MPLDLSTIGATTRPHRHTYGWKDLALYALGIGAERSELRYLYEGSADGLLAYPTYAVIPAFPVVVELLEQAGADMCLVLHRGQRVVSHAPIPIAATIETTGTLRGIFDLKKLAELSIATKSVCQGQLLFETEWAMLVRGAGGQGTRRPPDYEPGPRLPRERTPDWVVAQPTRPEQALLYRLSGDINPLHADPAVAARAGFGDAPILHGLCTYGYMARAVVSKIGGDASRLRVLGAEFRRPVWPGDTLLTQGFELDAGRIGLQVMVEGRPEPVVTNAWAEIASSGSAR